MSSLKAFTLSASSIFLFACAPFESARDNRDRVTTSDSSSGEEPFISPVRRESEDWNKALTRELNKLSALERSTADSGQSVINSAKPYAPSMDVSNLPEWTASSGALQNVFLTVRNERIYKQSSRPDFPRRATWLYPRDGCYARASHTAQSADRSGYARPGKVFAFGPLRFKSPFASGGVVYWSYHVAAAYRIGQKTFVLDPALNPRSPISLQQWIDVMKYDSRQIKVSVCDTYAYGVYHACLGGTSSSERSSTAFDRRGCRRPRSRIRPRKSSRISAAMARDHRRRRLFLFTRFRFRLWLRIFQ